jgi:hypothetical protein
MPTITQYAIGILLFAHGWVHFIYVASSREWFGPSEGWGWNGESWLLSGVLGERSILAVASVLFLLVAIGFVAGAVGYVLSGGWWEPVLVRSAIGSTLLYVVMWDGGFANLAEKGGLGVIIDVAIVVWILLVQ